MNEAKTFRPVASLIILTGLNLLDYLDRQLLAAVLTPLKEELGLSDGQLGTLQSAFMWGYFLTSPIFGYLGDKVPRRWLIAAGVFVWSIGTLMTGHMSALWALIFFRALVGLGEASFGTISPGWIADLFSGPRRNTAISIFYLAIPVGSALGYIIGSAIAARYGWRAAFLWAGYPGLLLAFLLFLMKEPPRGEKCGASRRACERASRLAFVSRTREASELRASGRGLYGSDLCDGRLRALGADVSLSRARHGVRGGGTIFRVGAGGNGNRGDARRWSAGERVAAAKRGGLQ